MEGWHGVQVRHLAALQAIDRERSFRGAAEQLGYVQSAVSQQIQKLEKLVGVRVVERSRGHGRIELTAAGKLLLGHANRVLAQMHAAQKELDTALRGTAGPLRVGAFGSVAARVMPRVLALLALRSENPEVACTDVPTDAALFELTQLGELDVAFAELPLATGTFGYRRLTSSRCALMARRDSALAAEHHAPTLADLAAIPLVEQPGWRKSKLIDGLFGDAGVEPNYRFQSNSDAATRGLVGAGLAAAIVSGLGIGRNDPEIAAIELDVIPRTTLVAYWNSEGTRHLALDAFLDAAEAVCSRLSIAAVPSLADKRASSSLEGGSTARLTAA